MSHSPYVRLPGASDLSAKKRRRERRTCGSKPNLAKVKESCRCRIDCLHGAARSRRYGAGGRTLLKVSAGTRTVRMSGCYRAVLVCLVGLTLMGWLTRSEPASPATRPNACTALTRSLATRLLGAPAIQAPFDHHMACTYRSTVNQDTVSLILTPIGQTRARTQRLLNRERRLFIGRQTAYWYRTPSRLSAPMKAGTLAVLKGDLLAVVAVRTVSDPQRTARRTMVAVLPHL